MPYHPSSPRANLVSAGPGRRFARHRCLFNRELRSRTVCLPYRVAAVVLRHFDDLRPAFTAKASLSGDLKGLSLAVGGRFPENALQADESLAGIVQQDWRGRGGRGG